MHNVDRGEHVSEWITTAGQVMYPRHEKESSCEKNEDTISLLPFNTILNVVVVTVSLKTFLQNSIQN